MKRGTRGQSTVEMGLVMGLVAILSVGLLMTLGPTFAEYFATRSGGGGGAQTKIANAVTTGSTTSTGATTTTTEGTTTTTAATTTTTTTTGATTTDASSSSSASSSASSSSSSSSSASSSVSSSSSSSSSSVSSSSSSSSSSSLAASPCAALDILSVSFSDAGGTGNNRRMNMSFTANAEVDSFSITWADVDGNSGSLILANGNNGGLSTGSVLAQSEDVNWTLAVFGCNGSLTLNYAKTLNLNAVPLTENP